jgi:hypothetical protein
MNRSLATATGSYVVTETSRPYKEWLMDRLVSMDEINAYLDAAELEEQEVWDLAIQDSLQALERRIEQVRARAERGLGAA